MYNVYKLLNNGKHTHTKTSKVLTLGQARKGCEAKGMKK